MSRKYCRPEQIILKLREAEIQLGKGLRTGEVCRNLGISQNTFYRWRKEYDVMGLLFESFISRGTPEYLRSDNGAEFTAKNVRGWLEKVEVKTLYIEPGSPWENGYMESFIGKFRDELLNGEIFDTLLEAKVLTERWRREYNTVRPHSALGYRPPAPETMELSLPKTLTLKVVQ